MRHPISIETSTAIRDSFGGVSTSWIEHVAAWAAVDVSTAGEFASGEQITANQEYTFTTRIDSAVSRVLPSMRIAYDGRYFDIKSTADVEERGKMLIIKAVERSL